MDYKKVMTNKLKLALIPARAGSKGIIDKNIVDLDGKPLMNWSIEIALNSNLFDVVCVSTDSSEIAHIARNAGAEVPFLRPIEISGDKSLQIDVMKHCLKFYQNRNLDFNSITLLQPTSPFRKIEDLASSLKLFSYQNYETLISVKDITEFENWCQKAFLIRPQRPEPIYKLAKFFREISHHYKCYEYIRAGEKVPFPKDDVLFIESNCYKGLFQYEKSY
jgi:CMP-N-acetylneuraminic acid synthetase